MFQGLDYTRMIVVLLGYLIFGALAVVVIRVALAPISAKLDRVIAVLEAHGRASGA